MAFNAYKFIFDGVPCEEYDLILYYSIDNTSQNDSSFTSALTIVEDRINRRYSALDYGGKIDKPLEFTLIFGVSPERIESGESLDSWEKESIASWLTGHQQYKWLDIIQPDLSDVHYKGKTEYFV